MRAAALTLVLVALGACQVPGDGAGAATASAISVTLAGAPAGIDCIAFTLADEDGTVTVESFAIGRRITLPNVAVGAYDLSAVAYAAADCGSIPTDAPWTTEAPVVVVVQREQVSTVGLALVPAGSVAVSAGFAGNPPSAPSSLRDYLTADVSAQVSVIGVWSPFDRAGAGLVDFWGVVRLGAEQREGVALAGWCFTGFSDSAPFTPVSIALLQQQADGTLALATDTLLPSALTNGAGSVLTADFNGDGKDDIFLAAHNESPIIGKASTAYLSNPDGSFTQVTLGDSAADHDASVVRIGGQLAVLAAGFTQADPQAIYTYDGHGNFDIDTSLDVVAVSDTAADLAGDGGTEIVFGDFRFGPNYPFDPNVGFREYVYRFAGDELLGTPTELTPPYFNDKPQYTRYVSEWDPLSKTHTSRMWTDDVNHDGKLDVVAVAEIWSSELGLQKATLQINVNQGNLAFTDETDELNPDFDMDIDNLDYSLRMADVDGSGINTYFLAGDTFTGDSRQGNFILVNDGSGRLHVAMHDEFTNLWHAVDGALQAHFRGSPYQYFAGSPPGRFIAYLTPAGKINFLVKSGALREPVADGQVLREALVNLPLGIDLAVLYRDDLTVYDRRGSNLIRTFAGDDTIFVNGTGGHCRVDGGAGFDTVVYRGPRSSYTVEKTASGYVVTDDVGSDGVDTLKNVERLQFTDGTMTLD